MSSRASSPLVRRLPLTLLLAGGLTLSACASALKRKCESTNWYEYGNDVARRGQRAAYDSFVQQCEREEAKINHTELSQGFQKGLDEYCTPDFAYRVGRSGEFLSEDMCSGSGIEGRMKTRHAEGVRDYCQPSNAQSAGAVGKKYNQICPKELERAFIPGFNEGRKRFLLGVIAQKEGEVNDLERDISDLYRRTDAQRFDIERLARRRLPVYAGQAAPPQNQEIDREIQSLQWQKSRFEREIDEKRAKQSELRQSIREAQGELPTL